MAKNCYIYETLNDVKSMSIQKTKDGFMHLSGVFGVCGVRNNNSRVYETKNYTKMVESMKERIKKAPIPGELEHPQTMNITLENISHRIDSIDIDENGVVSGEITLLDTPKGKIAQAIVEGGLPLFISSRATGNVDPKSGIVTLENLQTYDLVGSPGFSQAELHLNENQVAESINESTVYYITEKESDTDTKENTNENKDNDMELNEILERLESLEEKISTLEESNNQLMEENEVLREQVESAPTFDLEKIANGIQNWIVEEYSPMVQQWIVEEFAEEFRGDVVDEAVEASHSNFVEETAPKIQNWVVEEFAPEVEKWCCTELAEGIQNWTINEFAPEVEKWLNESYKDNLTDELNESIKTAIDESKANDKKDKLNAIDETLNLLESIEVSKPTYDRKANMVTENLNEPKYIAEMPAEARVQWEMAPQEVKESIARRAKLYNFMVEGAVEKFWQSIDFSAVKPVTNIYEGLNNVIDERERNIRAAFRSWRSNR